MVRMALAFFGPSNNRTNVQIFGKKLTQVGMVPTEMRQSEEQVISRDSAR